MDNVSGFPVYQSADIQRPKRSVLYIGKAKTGKTHFALSWPKTFVIYWDENMSTLLKFDTAFIKKNTKGENLTFEDFENKILPAIKNRTIDAETIVIDSVSFMAQVLRQAEVPAIEKGKSNRAKWGEVFDRLWQVFKDLAEVTQPDLANPDRRTYNLVCTVHERDVMDEDGNLVRYDPSIQGQFKDWLSKFFDTVLVTDIEYERVSKGNTVERVPRYIVHSIPPNRYWVAGDGVGVDLGGSRVDK